MSTKYSEIMNTSGLNGKLLRLNPEFHEQLFNLPSIVTEKIHGENIRVGIDGKGEFIGQRNNHFRNVEEHPNWNKLSRIAKHEIACIHSYIRGWKKNPGFKTKNITFFGELYGPGMQKGFEWDFDDGLRILWFDIKMNDKYLIQGEAAKHFLGLNLHIVPEIGRMTIREALELDIENIESIASKSPYIEGVVITPEEQPDWWRFPSRLIIKYKTKKYSEQKQGKHKSEKPIDNFVSKYVDFITEARIDHVIQQLKQNGIEIVYEMRDLQHLPKAVIADIEKEENEGEPLSKEDRKFLGKYIPKFYQEYLNQMLKDMQKELDRVKNNN